MTDTQEKELHCIVEDSTTTTTTNDSVVFLSRITMNNQNIWSGVSILLKGKQDQNTVVTVLADEDDNFEGNRIRMNSTVRSKLGVTVGDSVQLENVKEINYGQKITVCPVATVLGNATDFNSTDCFDLQSENLLKAYVRPYFFKAYRPIHQGDTFTADVTTAGGRKIKFQVIETIPSPFCIVGPGTNIEISVNTASEIPAPGDSIQVNLPLQEEEAVSTRSLSKKRNSNENEGSEVLVGNKRSKTDHLTKLDASSTFTYSIDSTGSTSKNDSLNAGVNQNIDVTAVETHSKAELQGLADKLGYINTLIVEHNIRFDNPELSQLQSWSTKFLKLEQDLHDESRNTATTNAFCELLRDSAPEILIKFLVQMDKNFKAERMCEVMLTQVPIFLGATADLWLWLYHQAISLARLCQAESALKLLENYEQQHNTVGRDKCKQVLKAKYLVGSILNSRMKSIEALPILQKVYDQQLISLGTNDLDTLKTNFEIGKCLKELERDQKALTIFQSVYKKWNLILGPNHDDTYNVAIQILHILMNLKRYDEALTLAEKMHEDQVNSEVLYQSHKSVIQRYIQNCVNLKKKQ